MSSLWKRLKEGLKKTSQRLQSGLSEILLNRSLGDDVLEDLEDTLILSDVGIATARDLINELRERRFPPDVSEFEIRTHLAESIKKRLIPFEQKLRVPERRPWVILMIGANGGGKTTTIGKLGALWKKDGFFLRFVSADTFRAAAEEQLHVWADRIGASFTGSCDKKDPASVAFEGIQDAMTHNEDIVLIDTAGRLPNKAPLMDQLKKIDRVISKSRGTYTTLLVLDATTGQNAYTQVELFKDSVPITGLILTKLDGTAKGGILVKIATELEIPVCAIGTGEQCEDLLPFSASAFSKGLLGIES